MKKLRELLRLKFGAKLAHRQIGRALNISAGTVSYYAQAADACGLGWPLPEGLDDKALLAQLEPLAKQLRCQPVKRVLPDWKEIHQALRRKHMTLMVLWEDYAKAHPGRSYSYAQFTRRYKAWCKKKQVSMRLEQVPGEAAFIDYAGTTLPVYCRQTGNVLFNAHVFIMALGASREYKKNCV